MLGNQIKTSINFFKIILLGGLFMFLPLYPKITSVLIGLLVVVSFFYSNKLPLNQYPKVYFLFPVLFFLYVISLIFTDNMTFWLKDIETKLSFIVIPIIFYNLGRDIIKRKELYFLLFIIGTLISATLSYLKGIECWELQKQRLCFESSHLAYNFHPTYLSLYYIVAIVISWYQAFKSKQKLAWGVIAILVTFVLGYFIYHFYSVGPWVALFLSIIVFLFYFFYQQKQILKFIISIVILFLILMFSIKKFELFESDFTVLKNELTEFATSPQKYYKKNKGNTSSTKARLIIWNITLKLINQNKFGVGGGDIKDVLIKEYNDLGLTEYAKHKLNPHNQYLQTALALGVFVGLFLFLSMIYLMIYSFKHNNTILLIIATLLFTSMFFESILENQAGVVFFMLMIYFNLALSPLKTAK